MAKNDGVYIDTRTGKVVESQPEEGIQLVPPGGEITKSRQAVIDRYKEAAAGTESAPKTVTTRRAPLEEATALDDTESAVTKAPRSAKK